MSFLPEDFRRRKTGHHCVDDSNTLFCLDCGVESCLIVCLLTVNIVQPGLRVLLPPNVL